MLYINKKEVIWNYCTIETFGLIHKSFNWITNINANNFSVIILMKYLDEQIKVLLMKISI